MDCVSLEAASQDKKLNMAQRFLNPTPRLSSSHIFYCYHSVLGMVPLQLKNNNKISIPGGCAGLCPLCVGTRVLSVLGSRKHPRSDGSKPAQGPRKQPRRRRMSLGLFLMSSCLYTQIQGRQGCKWTSKWAPCSWLSIFLGRRYWVGEVGRRCPLVSYALHWRTSGVGFSVGGL